MNGYEALEVQRQSYLRSLRQIEKNSNDIAVLAVGLTALLSGEVARIEREQAKMNNRKAFILGLARDFLKYAIAAGTGGMLVKFF